MPSLVEHVEAGKQKKIYAKITVLNIPFNIPEIEIEYKRAEDNSKMTERSLLPLAFNKFVETMSFHNDFHELDPRHLKTNDFIFNKNIPLERLPEFLSNWSILSSNLNFG